MKFNINYMDLWALLLTLVFFGIIYFLGKKKGFDFGVLTLLATVFGIIVGLIFKENFNYVEIFGKIYTNIISAFVVPLLIFSIISSLTNLGESIHLKKIGFKSIFYLLLNTFTASVITLIAAVSLKMGKGFVYTTVTNYEPTEIPTFIDTLVSLFPSNLILNWSDGQVVPVVVFAIIVAIAYNSISRSNEDIKIFKKFIDAGNKVMGQAIGYIMDFTPYAVLSLIARAVGRANLNDLIPLLGVMILAYVLSAVHIFGVQTMLIKFLAKLSPIKYLKKVAPAGIVAFTSQSSIGTIPVTVRQLENKMGVDSDVAAFTAGLGANLGMPGCAGIWPTLLAVFTINVLGLDYSIGQYAFIVVLAIVVSLGTVGVPGTATVTATALFSAAGLPIEMIVLFQPISSIVDMARTATNVVGASTAAVIVAKSEGLLDEKVFENEAV